MKAVWIPLTSLLLAGVVCRVAQDTKEYKGRIKSGRGQPVQTRPYGGGWNDSLNRSSPAGNPLCHHHNTTSTTTTSNAAAAPPRSRTAAVGRFLFSVVRIANTRCGTDGTSGTCYTAVECQQRRGVSIGSCARGFGVYCYKEITCGGTTSTNCTYLVSPGFPSTYADARTCTMTVTRTPNICQLRLDFDSFDTFPPDQFGQLDKPAIRSGMDHWMEHTCIKFEETKNTAQQHLRYIYGSGCHSYVGMLSSTGQNVSIGENCNVVGVVAHELGHAMGMLHEQSRPDRDDFVVINYENIENEMQKNFKKGPKRFSNSYDIPYDYYSVMHYDPKGFTINSKTTIATKDPLAQGLIGQRSGLSHRDNQLANIMYNCIDKWLAKCGVSTDPCQNGGYYGAGCACVCPTGTSGTNCETTTGGYYDTLRNSCTEKVTEKGTLTSPNYPRDYPATRCVKWIEAPECHVPKLTFSYFKLFHMSNYCGDNSCCYFDSLEIRSGNKHYGDVYCDKDISAGQSFTGTDREMILFFRTETDHFKGWSADLTFVKQEGCA